MLYEYEVALSFAGEDRSYVDEVAEYLKRNKITLFYDKYEEANLWGKNLFDYLYDVYCNRSLYVVMFISSSYLDKEWTTHERTAAQSRAFAEKDNEYILPARFDDTKIPGLPSTIGYIDLRNVTPAVFAEKLIQKINNHIPFEARTLVESLHSADPSIRKSAAIALGSFGSDVVVEELVNVIKVDDDWEVKISAIYSLRNIGGPSVEDALTELMSDSDENVRAKVIQILSRMDGVDCFQRLLISVNDRSTAVRKASIEALGMCNNLLGVQLLIEMTSSGDVQIFEAAISALKNFEEERIVDSLVEAMKSKNVQTRRAIVEVLSSFDDMSSFDLLVKALNDDDSRVRKEAIRALAYVDEIRALPFLYEAINDSNPEVAIAALEEIEDAVKDTPVDVVKKATASVPKDVVATVVRALEEFGGQSNLSIYIESCRDEGSGA